MYVLKFKFKQILQPSTFLQIFIFNRKSYAGTAKSMFKFDFQPRQGLNMVRK